MEQQGRQLSFTSTQAAKYLGVSLATIRRWTDAGFVPCHRTPGNMRRYSKADLNAFAERLREGHRPNGSGPSARADV